LPAAQWHHATLRQIVHRSIGRTQLRPRVSNVFGTQPLVPDAASIALCAGPGRADADSASLRPLRFDTGPGLRRPADPVYHLA
jgi:hypothetical protein